MNIICCVKQVPDTETKIQLEDGQISEKGINWVLNPYDEFAVEEALRIKEQRKQGSIRVLSVGPARAQEALKRCLSLGCEEATHLSDPAFEGSDSLAVARLLAAAIKTFPCDLILCGKQGVDNDCAQVPIMLAELLGMPHATVVTKLVVAEDGKSAVAHREVEGGKAVVELALPAVITCQKGLNIPRTPSLKGIMAVKKKTIATIGPAALAVAPESVGTAGASTTIEEIFLPPTRQAGKLVDGETPEQKAAALAKLLREEAKVI